MSQTTTHHRTPLEANNNPQNLAWQAAQRLRLFAHLSRMNQQCEVQRLATAEGWDFWLLGGFCFPDGSVLRFEGSGWQALSPEEARAHLKAEQTRPLEVLLLHTFIGTDGRGKRSISQARFEPLSEARWCLEVQYEAFIDSPLYGFRADGFKALLELNLCALRVDTPQPSARWRLERIALYPDWLELLTVSIAPDFHHLQTMNAPKPAPLEAG